MQNRPMSQTLGAAPTSAVEVGGIGRRFVALVVDGIIFGVVQFPITFGVAMIAGVSARAQMDATTAAGTQLTVQAISWAISLVMIYFYYGWFYKNKGGTPGKLLMGLKVVDAETGAHLSYGKAFLRETIGRMCDGILMVFFFAGVLIPIFRKDKRAAHDFVAGTQVLRS